MKKGKLKSKNSNSIKLHTLDSYLQEQLKNPAFKKAYEKEGNKLALGYQIFLLRTKLGMSQAELARRIGTRQSNISRLEFGNYNFTVEMLQKIASALGSELKIALVASNAKKAA